MINYAELKKLKPRFYSEVLRKKFFVLYEDSRQSLTHPRDHSQSNGDLSDVSKFTKFLKMSNFFPQDVFSYLSNTSVKNFYPHDEIVRMY